MTLEAGVEDVRALEILVDGAENRTYMLQIFLKEQAGLLSPADVIRLDANLEPPPPPTAASTK